MVDRETWVAIAEVVLAAIAAIGGLYAIGALLFGLVSRRELSHVLRELKKDWDERLEKMQASRAAMRAEDQLRDDKRHEDNRRLFTGIFRRLGDVEQTVAGIEGQMVARFEGDRRGRNGNREE